MSYRIHSVAVTGSIGVPRCLILRLLGGPRKSSGIVRSSNSVKKKDSRLQIAARSNSDSKEEQCVTQLQQDA